MTIQILIVDDHSVVRQGLRMFLSLDSDLEVVGEASNGAEGVQLARELRPQVVLMDLLMPVMDGVTATAFTNPVSTALGTKRTREPSLNRRAGPRSGGRGRIFCRLAQRITGQEIFYPQEIIAGALERPLEGAHRGLFFYLFGDKPA
jgi:hypothetical protein